MMYQASLVFVLCFLVSTAVAGECPVGCSCRGPDSEFHTAICYNDVLEPAKDFSPAIKTLELRYLPFSSMRRFLKHAPDVTDLIIHDIDGAVDQPVPKNLFHGLKSLKSLTFHTLKEGAVPKGLAGSLDGLDRLRFLDLGRNRLECNCELSHWIGGHDVILLGVRTLSPSTNCREVGFDKDVYNAKELVEMCDKKQEGNLKELADEDVEDAEEEGDEENDDLEESYNDEDYAADEDVEKQESTPESKLSHLKNILRGKKVDQLVVPAAGSPKTDSDESAGKIQPFRWGATAAAGKSPQAPKTSLANKPNSKPSKKPIRQNAVKHSSPTSPLVAAPRPTKIIAAVQSAENPPKSSTSIVADSKATQSTKENAKPMHIAPKHPSTTAPTTASVGSTKGSGMPMSLESLPEILSGVAHSKVSITGGSVKERGTSTPPSATAATTLGVLSTSKSVKTSISIETPGESSTIANVLEESQPDEDTEYAEEDTVDDIAEYFDTTEPTEKTQETSSTTESKILPLFGSEKLASLPIFPKTNQIPETVGNTSAGRASGNDSTGINAGPHAEEAKKILKDFMVLLLKRLAANGVGSPLDELAVDVKLHPNDPFELRLLMEYVQHISGKPAEQQLLTRESVLLPRGQLPSSELDDTIAQ
ncbi:uncharacterized protein LOC110977250 [Acanthaster planci]|uniref:Uncharacterized protein LOC110977250 n=1 Tax=Acanthaster planci TaxID=133434 RepID=A0A8B7Y2Y1_ACAPL|nr:uncharacterized protein LOC110977250 [Acanthaster planci]